MNGTRRITLIRLNSKILLLGRLDLYILKIYLKIIVTIFYFDFVKL